MSGQGDELRIRAYLRALRARPFGHQEPAMTHDRRPITPARVIPAGTRTSQPVGADELRARSYLYRMGVVL